MLTESEVRSRVVDALEMVTPPAPWLASRIERAVEAQTQPGHSRRGLRIRLGAFAALALVGLVLASLASFLLLRPSVIRSVPAGPNPAVTPGASSSSTYSRGWAFGGPAMVTRTDGWDCCVPFGHTSDGGVHWADVRPKGVTGDPYYLDAAHAWLNAWSGVGPVQLTTYRTADAGQTWEHGTTLTISAEGLGNYQFYFLDPERGWLLVSTKETVSGQARFADSIYTTIDGGLHWTVAAVHTAPPTWSSPKFYCYEWCNSMAFISPSTGWLSVYQLSGRVGPALLVTHDGGVTWKQQSLPASSVQCPCFAEHFLIFDDRHAMFLLSGPYQAVTSSALAMTSDGGQSWLVRSLPGKAYVTVGFYDPQHGWAVAGPQSILDYPPSSGVTPPTLSLPLYRTEDGGSTWKPVHADLQLQSPAGRVLTLYFVDADVGFVVRTVTSNGPWDLLKTTDGGRTWNLIASNL